MIDRINIEGKIIIKKNDITAMIVRDNDGKFEWKKKGNPCKK